MQNSVLVCSFTWWWEPQPGSLTSPPLQWECTPLLPRVTNQRIHSIWEKKSPRGVRETSPLTLRTWSMLLCWGDDHSSSASRAPRHVNIHFLHPVQLQRESTNVQRDGEGSQEPCSSNLFPCQLPTSLLEFDVIHLYISSSTSFSLFHPPPFISFSSCSYTLLWEKMHDLWSSIFTGYRGEREERGGDKEEGEKKRGRRIEGRVWRASPRGERTGECEGDIHHPATPWLKMKTGSRLRQKYDGSDQD